MTEKMNVPTISFLGEQDGAPERELKESLVRLLPKLAVRRAYLVRVLYEKPETELVALRLSGPPSEQVVSEIAQVFSSMFNEESALDIMFVAEEEESRLARVCAPFFERSQAEG